MIALPIFYNMNIIMNAVIKISDKHTKFSFLMDECWFKLFSVGLTALIPILFPKSCRPHLFLEGVWLDVLKHSSENTRYQSICHYLVTWRGTGFAKG